jgi:hypothetical protein
MIKKLLLVLALLILPFQAIASDPTPRFHIIQDFSKGLNSHISDTNVAENQGTEATNVRVNNRFSSLAKRDLLLTAWDAGSASVNGLHRYYKSDATVKTIIATSTFLDIGDATATTTTHIESILTDGKRWQFVTYKDVAIGTNGYDQPVKYDGHTLTTANTDNARTAADLCAQLGAPFAQLSSENGGNDLDASSWYQYKVVFYDGTTYSCSQARSNPIVTGSSVQNITLTGVPIGPVGTTHRYIYRNLGAATRADCLADTTFYMVKDLADNTTLTFDDAMADATADDNTAPTWATATTGGIYVTPPTGKYLNIHKERLWIAGNTTNQSDLDFSDDGNPDYFDPDNFFIIRADDGDEITFVKTFLGLLTIGKTNSIQKLYTDGSTVTDWYASDPFSFVGCPAPYTADVTPKGIIYLGRKGLYLFNGQNSQLISDAVTPQINDISQADIADTAGIYFNDEYRLAYTSSSSGGSTNNRVLLYNFIRDAYVLDTENINCFAVFNSGTDLGTLYSGSSAADGYVVGHTYASPTLTKRYKSEIDTGTFADTRSYGTEDEPQIDMSWSCTIATWLTDLQAKNASINTLADIITYLPTATIARPDGTGTWTSPVYEIGASTLDKIYWNENLGAFGDVTFQVRLGATSGACAAASWETAVTNPNGSDISGVTANSFIQIRANLTTSDTAYTPYLFQTDGYLFKLLYSKIGAANETSVLSIYKTGWKDFGVPGYKKQIQRIKVFYKGTAGTLNFNIIGDDGDINKTFTIDLSKATDFSTTDEYTGDGDIKVFTFLPPMNSATEPSLISQLFQYTLTETGAIGWEIKKIETKFVVEELYD